MHAFVQRGGRPGSPAPQQQHPNMSATRRRQIAESVRVQPPLTNLAARNGAQNARPQTQNGLMGPPPRPVVVKHEHVEVAVLNGGAQGDGFDTDFEGYDDATTTISEVQVEDSQKELHTGAGRQDEYEGEESEEDEQEEGAMEEYNQNAGFPPDMQGTANFLYQNAARMQAQQGGLDSGQFNPFPPQDGFLANDNSYPTTTSGRLDDEETVDGGNQVVQISSDPNADEEEDNSPSPQKPQQPQIRRPVATQPAITTSAHFGQPQQPPHSLSQPPVFKQAATLRQQSRSQPTLPVRETPAPAAVARPHASQAPPKPISQPPTGSQAQRGNQRQALPTPPAAKPPTPAPSTGKQPGDAAQSQKPETQPPAPEQEQEGPPFDYATPALYDMPYADLQKESFDYNPRAPAPVFPPDKVAAPLPERLAYAHRQLDPKQQQRFFASLNIDEWEDAGDWFLEQFGALTKKVKELRREKRKLASKFEDEVAERDAQVARKKQRLNEEMEGMKSQGQGLLRTPTKK